MGMRQTQFALVALAAIGGIVMTASTARGQCQYEVTIIQAPECPPLGHPPTIGVSLNEHGHVVGYYYSCGIPSDLPFLWTPEDGFQPLPMPPGAIEATASDINDAGVICGGMQVADGYRGWVSGGGEWTILEPCPGGLWSGASAINNAGQVVGFRSIGNGVYPQNGFLWSASGGFIDFGLIEGDSNSAVDLNDAAQVAGSKGVSAVSDEAFLWETGEVVLMGPVPGGLTSSAGAINNRSQIVGAGRIELKVRGGIVARAFLWEDDTVTMLGVLSGYDGSTARGLNDVTQVVGQLNSSANPNDHRAFLWQAGDMHDLNDLALLDRGQTIARAFAIGNSGRIVADGHDAAGDVVTFLLTPIGRPAGDITGDCSVDHEDLHYLLSDWGSSESLADVNHDGTVNVLDLLIVLADWTAVGS